MKKLSSLWNTSDQFIRLPLIFFLFCVVLVTAPLLIFYNSLPPRLPLLYSLPWGNQQLVTKQQFFLLPAILIVINLVNLLISSSIHPLQFTIKRLLILSLILIDLIILITTLKVLSIFL